MMSCYDLIRHLFLLLHRWMSLTLKWDTLRTSCVAPGQLHRLLGCSISWLKPAEIELQTVCAWLLVMTLIRDHSMRQLPFKILLNSAESDHASSHCLLGLLALRLGSLTSWLSNSRSTKNNNRLLEGLLIALEDSFKILLYGLQVVLVWFCWCFWTPRWLTTTGSSKHLN